MYGYAADEIEGRPLSVLAAGDAPEIDELLGQAREAARRAEKQCSDGPMGRRSRRR